MCRSLALACLGWRRAGRSPKERTAYPFSRMTRYLRVRKVPLAQVILILMNDQSPSQEVFWLNIRDEITVSTGAFATEFNIPQIPSMTLSFRTRFRSVVLRRPHMKVLTGPLAAFASQIPCPVNMKPMFPSGRCVKVALSRVFPCSKVATANP